MNEPKVEAPKVGAYACPFLQPVPQKDPLGRITLNLHPCIKGTCQLWSGTDCGMKHPGTKV